MVHRCAEWDGWEEGLIDSVLGKEDEDEEAWFRDLEDEEDKEVEDEGDDIPESVMEQHGTQEK
jgi:hypothetical protein